MMLSGSWYQVEQPQLATRENHRPSTNTFFVISAPSCILRLFNAQETHSKALRKFSLSRNVLVSIYRCTGEVPPTCATTTERN